MTHDVGIVSDLNDIFGPSFVAAVSPAFLFGVHLLFPLQVVQVRIMSACSSGFSQGRENKLVTISGNALNINHHRIRPLESDPSPPQAFSRTVKAVSNPIQLNILDRLLCLKLVVTRSHHIGIKARDSDLESAFKEHLSGVMDLPVK